MRQNTKKVPPLHRRASQPTAVCNLVPIPPNIKTSTRLYIQRNERSEVDEKKNNYAKKWIAKQTVRCLFSVLYPVCGVTDHSPVSQIHDVERTVSCFTTIRSDISHRISDTAHLLSGYIYSMMISYNIKYPTRSHYILDMGACWT